MDQPGRGSFQAAIGRDAAIWPQRHTAGEALPYRQPPAAGAAGMATFGFGLERRLARRAETMWGQLAAANGLPPATAATQFLRGGYAANAMHLHDQADGALCIERIGDGLQSIAHLNCGPYQPNNPDHGHMVSPLGRTLLELARAAMVNRLPMRIETERMATRPHAGQPHLLLRAVALPFQSPNLSERMAVVIASWRKLLSAEETAALHRELKSAMDWMRRQRPHDPAAAARRPGATDATDATDATGTTGTTGA